MTASIPHKETAEEYKRAFLQKVCHPPNHKQADNIKDRFIDGGKSYFLFLDKEGVSPTNNLTEQAIRFVVIDRYITRGSRSDAGMRWCERAWTAVATCATRGVNVFDFYHDTIKAKYTDGQYPSLIPAKL